MVLLLSERSGKIVSAPVPDEDGVANGVIVDPSGPGLNIVGAPNTGL